MIFLFYPKENSVGIYRVTKIFHLLKMVKTCSGICIDTQTQPEETINKIGLNNPWQKKYMRLFVVKSNYILQTV
jgi:hypothetical protein